MSGILGFLILTDLLVNPSAMYLNTLIYYPSVFICLANQLLHFRETMRLYWIQTEPNIVFDWWDRVEWNHPTNSSVWLRNKEDRFQKRKYSLEIRNRHILRKF